MARHLAFKDHNYLNNPQREAQLILARAIDADALEVDVFYGPAGSCGFRKGTWKCTYGGRSYSFFASVPHACDLDKQTELLRYHAILAIAKEAIPA